MAGRQCWGGHRTGAITANATCIRPMFVQLTALVSQSTALRWRHDLKLVKPHRSRRAIDGCLSLTARANHGGHATALAYCSAAPR